MPSIVPQTTFSDASRAPQSRLCSSALCVPHIICTPTAAQFLFHHCYLLPPHQSPGVAGTGHPVVTESLLRVLSHLSGLYTLSLPLGTHISYGSSFSTTPEWPMVPDHVCSPPSLCPAARPQPRAVEGGAYSPLILPGKTPYLWQFVPPVNGRPGSCGSNSA